MDEREDMSRGGEERWDEKWGEWVKVGGIEDGDDKRVS
jgi:hypothetical protein